MRQRTVIITGASSGIGAAIALQLAASSRLLLVARRAERLEDLVAQITQQGGEARGHVADLADPEQIAGIVSAAEAAFGGIEALINNAGVLEFRPTAALDQAHIDRHLAVNVRAPMLLTAAALPFLRAAHGWVINISSIVCDYRFPACGVYTASKMALEGFSRCLREEERAQGLRVGLVAPGPTDTDIFDGAEFDRTHMMRAQDIARSVVHMLDTPASASIEHMTIMPPGGVQ